MNKCLVCDKMFESKRKDAKYCSTSCRVTFNRNKNTVTDNSVTDNVTDKADVLVTDKTVAVEGLCHGCGKPVSELVCICLSCITKGVTHKGIDCQYYDKLTE